MAREKLANSRGLDNEQRRSESNIVGHLVEVFVDPTEVACFDNKINIEDMFNRM